MLTPVLHLHLQPVEQGYRTLPRRTMALCSMQLDKGQERVPEKEKTRGQKKKEEIKKRQARKGFLSCDCGGMAQRAYTLDPGRGIEMAL